MTTKFMKSLMKKVTSEKGPYVTIMAEEEGAAEFTGCIDTGSYALNAVLSGSIYGGIPNNKISMFMGDPATGKTFFVLGLCRSFLENNKDAIVFYYDTEAAVTNEMMEDRGIDTSRVVLVEPDTIETFHVHVMKVLNEYENAEEKAPLLIVLDSWGNLPSNKELGDSSSGDIKADQGLKAKAGRAVFRQVTLKAGKVGVPFVFTNHTYEQRPSNPTSQPIVVPVGGKGAIYASSTIALLTKSKDYEGDKENDGEESKKKRVVVGSIIHVKMYKSRLSKENSVVHVKIRYDGGLDKYYGLLELAEKYGIIKKESTRFVLADGRKVWGKEINENPESVYTKDILDKLDEAAKKEFSYGRGLRDGDSQTEADVSD